jgi:hypothetical protein
MMRAGSCRTGTAVDIAPVNAIRDGRRTAMSGGIS